MGRREISIFGSTGSIGSTTVKLLLQQGGSEHYDIKVLTGGNNIKLLADQAIKLCAGRVVTAYNERLEELQFYLKGSGIEVAAGEEALLDASNIYSDWAMSSIVGAAGIKVGINSAKHGRTIALANKETMVCAGNIINKVAKEHDTTIIPVDSEHSAIFQCCRGEKKDEIESITLTASGGPFRDWPIDKLKDVSAEMAANHPNWSMGKKISIDSASMFNKGLEVIEANVLFGLEGQKINVLIHPQSIVHAFVNFNDGSTIAQMSRPDMISAIGFALNYPDRSYIDVERIDLIKTGGLTFEEMDFERWPALRLAYDIINLQSSSGAAYNASKEEALTAFIENEIGFLDMYKCVHYVINYLKGGGYFENKSLGLSEIFEVDSLARKLTKKYITNKSI
jgi:1-deoxy-D-xylulose-5-phosphate reductoisomerase